MSRTLHLSSKTWILQKRNKKPEARDRVRRQIEKRSEEIAKMIHPHDDEPDPTAYMGTITSRNVVCLLCWVLYYVCLGSG